MANSREQVGDVVVVKAITDVATVAPADDEPQLAQDAKLLRNGARRHFDLVGELLDRSLSAQEREQQADSALSTEDLHADGDGRGLGGRQILVGRIVLERVRHARKATQLNTYAGMTDRI